MSGIKLKLSMPKGIDGFNRTPSIASVGTPATPAPTSAVTPGGSKPAPKLKFKAPSQPPTPAPAPVEVVPKPKKTKAGRTTKPSAKLADSKKRLKEDSDSENEGSTIAVVPPPQKKIKIKGKTLTPSTAGPKTPGAVIIKAKVKGKPPRRPPGEGYDSEASDREEDPYIEEEFVLRMVPGEDCEYLRNAIAEKKIGIAKNLGGADIQMKFFHQDGRRAAITIRGHCYAATLVDLPCVIEGMKSWDRRGWWKSADICQMLWVFASINTEEEAKTIALPKIIDPVTFQYPHGLTPPMHFARKRRFRKRISRTAIEAVEDAVEKLLAEDAKAASTKWEWIDPDASRHGSRAFSPGDSEPGYEEFSEDEDAEGEADDTGYFNGVHSNGPPPVPFDEDMGDLEADLEAAFGEESLAAETPSSAVAVTPSMLNGGDTPAVEDAAEEEDEEDSGDESLEDDDDDEETGAPVEVDENEKARLAHIQSIKEDIADMEKQIEDAHQKLATTSNLILRKRGEDNIRKMKAELTLKISSLPAESNDDD
jgi:transcription initiation factor TFIID subunit 7